MSKVRNKAITQSQLKALLSYDPDSGVFTRLVKRGRFRAGSQAGYVDERGYWMIEIDGVAYPLHRLAWLHEYGEHPAQCVDHINGNPSDNRLINLRLASHAENMQNYRAPNSSNTTGYLGVSFYKRHQKFTAHIRVAGKRFHLGYFQTAEEASRAYLKAKSEHHPFQTIA